MTVRELLRVLKDYAWGAALLALLLGFVFWPPVAGRAQDDAAAGLPLVTTMRISQEGDVNNLKKPGHTRIVLAFDKAVDHRWFTLNNPARVVVDFPPVQFVTQPGLVEMPEGGLLKGMRAGLFRPGIVRMVIDLSAPSRVSVFAIPGGSSQGPRLVVDVSRVKPGQVPTEVAPPSEVVTTVAWTPPGAPVASVLVTPSPTAVNQTVEQPAPVVPPKVPTPIPGAPSGPLVVALDAGHGGVDPGACSGGACEKHLTLDMARRVGRLLAAKGIRVIYTRDRDEYIPLGERSRIAERAQADVFVSLHADSHPDRDVEGGTVYMVSEKASDKEAARLAESENAGDILAGVGFENESREVQGILISLVQRDTLNNSAYLARRVLDKMRGVADIRKPDPLFAGFKVLKSPDVPSILVEMGYLTNRHENRKLRDDGYRQRLAQSIADGIGNYLDHHVHLKTPLALKAAEPEAVPEAAPAPVKTAPKAVPKKTRKKKRASG